MVGDGQRTRKSQRGQGVRGGVVWDAVRFRAIYCPVTNKVGDPVRKSPICDSAHFLYRNRTHPVQNQGYGGYRPIITIKSVRVHVLISLPTFLEILEKNNRTARSGPMGARARNRQMRVNKGKSLRDKRRDARSLRVRTQDPKLVRCENVGSGLSPKWTTSKSHKEKALASAPLREPPGQSPPWGKRWAWRETTTFLPFLCPRQKTGLLKRRRRVSPFCEVSSSARRRGWWGETGTTGPVHRMVTLRRKLRRPARSVSAEQ